MFLYETEENSSSRRVKREVCPSKSWQSDFSFPSEPQGKQTQGKRSTLPLHNPERSGAGNPSVRVRMFKSEQRGGKAIMVFLIQHVIAFIISSAMYFVKRENRGGL